MTDLATLADVKAYAGVAGAADDAILQRMITAYSGWVRQYCSRDLTSQSYDTYRSGRGQAAIMLPQYPISAVALVQIDGQAIAAQSSFGATGYRFTARSIVLDGLCFSFGRSNIRIQYTAGYASVPADIAQAVCELVALRYKERDRIGFASKTLAGETVSFITKAMPDSVRMLLDQYVNVVPA